MSPMEAQRTIDVQLAADEKLLWTGFPDPVRQMKPTWFVCGFGLFWNAFIINFIVMWHGHGHQDVSGPFGLFGMQGLLSDLFFVPFILVGLGTLLSPWFAYRRALNTAYGITDKRILIVRSGRTARVQTYGPSAINMLEREEYANGTGTVTFSRSSYRDSDGDRQTREAKFTGIPNPREVEQLIRNTFQVAQ